MSFAIPARVALLAALVAAAPAIGQEQAVPFPPHWTHENDDEDDDGYRRPPMLDGIYGHGVSGSQAFDAASDGETCKGSEEERRKLAEAIGFGTEFWFYATGAQGVLFTRKARVDHDKPCVTALHYDQAISRAFVADRLVHRMEQNDDGDFEYADTRPIGASDGEYSSGFDMIHNLMARTGPPGGRKLEADRIAGIPVRCGGFGGIVWKRVCVATSGRARGMLLFSAAGDDEREMFHLEFDRLDSAARIDGRLFELQRTWTAE